MSDALDQLPDAIVSQIAAHDYGVTFSITRSYGEWDIPLEDQDDLRCDVVLGEQGTVESESHSSQVYLWPVTIGFRKKFGPSATDPTTGRISNAAIDQCKGILKETIDLLWGSRRPSDLDSAVLMRMENVMPFSRKHLANNRQYTGLFTAIYRLTVEN